MPRICAHPRTGENDRICGAYHVAAGGISSVVKSHQVHVWDLMCHFFATPYVPSQSHHPWLAGSAKCGHACMCTELDHDDSVIIKLYARRRQN
eukprot:1206044-Amphidinium_carterae.1